MPKNVIDPIVITAFHIINSMHRINNLNYKSITAKTSLHSQPPVSGQRVFVLAPNLPSQDQGHSLYNIFYHPGIWLILSQDLSTSDRVIHSLRQYILQPQITLCQLL